MKSSTQFKETTPPGANAFAQTGGADFTKGLQQLARLASVRGGGRWQLGSILLPTLATMGQDKFSRRLHRENKITGVSPI